MLTPYGEVTGHPLVCGERKETLERVRGEARMVGVMWTTNWSYMEISCVRLYNRRIITSQSNWLIGEKSRLWSRRLAVHAGLRPDPSLSLSGQRYDYVERTITTYLYSAGHRPHLSIMLSSVHLLSRYIYVCIYICICVHIFTYVCTQLFLQVLPYVYLHSGFTGI